MYLVSAINIHGNDKFSSLWIYRFRLHYFQSIHIYILFFSLWKFIKLSFIVVATFLLIWFPFLKTIDGFTQVLARIFPVARGIYEVWQIYFLSISQNFWHPIFIQDKVANFWCTTSILIKWKNHFDNQQIALIRWGLLHLITLNWIGYGYICKRARCYSGQSIASFEVQVF